MSRDKKSGGLGRVGVVQIVIIVLKLTGLVSWSWLVVLVLLALAYLVWETE